MLAIKIKGEKLDLPSDITFEYHIKNPFFEDKTIPVPATYTFSVPPTPRNNRLLAYPLRINQKTRLSEFEAEVSYGSVVIASGIVVRKKTTQNGNINLYFKAQNEEDLLDKPLCELPLGEYQFSQENWVQELNALCERSFSGEEPFALPMVRTKAHSESVAFFYSASADPAKISKYIRFYMEKFLNLRVPTKIVSPSSVYLNPYYVYSQTLNEGSKYYQFTHPTRRGGFGMLAPFPYLWHIVDVVFSSLGIADNPFKDGDELEKIIVSGTYKPPMGDDFENKVFRVNKSLPNCTAADFLKNVLKAFGLTLNRLKGKTSVIAYDDVLTQEPVADWSDIILDGWSVEEEKQESLLAGLDTGVPEFTENEVEDKRIVEVENPYQIMYKLYLMAYDLTVDGRRYYKKDIAKTCWYVSSTREFYYSAVDDETKRFWVTFKGVKPLDTGNFPHKKKNRQASINIAPMVLDYAIDNFNPDFTKEPVNGVYEGAAGTQKRFMYLPFIESKCSEQDFKPTLLSYLGKEASYIPVDANSQNVAPAPRYPFASTNGHNPYNKEGVNFSKVGDYSKTAKLFFESKRLKLKGKVMLSEKQIQRLTGVDVVVFRGKRWLLQEISIPIKMRKIYPSKITLIEIPEIDVQSKYLSFPNWTTWT